VAIFADVMSTWRHDFLPKSDQSGPDDKELNPKMLIDVNIISILARKKFFKYQKERPIRYYSN